MGGLKRASRECQRAHEQRFRDTEANAATNRQAAFAFSLEDGTTRNAWRTYRREGEKWNLPADPRHAGTLRKLGVNQRRRQLRKDRKRCRAHARSLVEGSLANEPPEKRAEVREAAKQAAAPRLKVGKKRDRVPGGLCRETAVEERVDMGWWF